MKKVTEPTTKMYRAALSQFRRGQDLTTDHLAALDESNSNWELPQSITLRRGRVMVSSSGDAAPNSWNSFSLRLARRFAFFARRARRMKLWTKWDDNLSSEDTNAPWLNYSHANEKGNLVIGMCTFVPWVEINRFARTRGWWK